MQKALFTAALAALLTVAVSSASAQEAPPPPPMQGHGQPPHGDGFQPPRGPGFAAINDLEQLRRLYAMAGRENEMVALYHDVLNKTQDPMLRHFVYDSLAREQLKPANPDQAIATLRTSLAEDIVAANRMPPVGRPGADGPRPETPPAPPQP